MRFRNCVLISLMAGLIGCATKVEYVDRPIYVDRVVPVPCVDTMPEQPTFAVTLLKRSDNADTVTKAYMVERRQRMSYEARLEAVLLACMARSGLGPESAPGKADGNTTDSGKPNASLPANPKS